MNRRQISFVCKKTLSFPVGKDIPAAARNYTEYWLLVHTAVASGLTLPTMQVCEGAGTRSYGFTMTQKPEIDGLQNFKAKETIFLPEQTCQVRLCTRPAKDAVGSARP